MRSEPSRGSSRMARADPQDEEHAHVGCVGDSSEAFTVIFFPVFDGFGTQRVRLRIQGARRMDALGPES